MTVKPRRRARRHVRIALGLVLIPVVLLVIAAGSLLLVMQDQKFGNEAINAKVVELLQNAAGDRFEIGIGKTGFTLKSSTLLALSADNVTVTDRNTGEKVAEINQVNAGFNPLSLLSGGLDFNRFVVNGGLVNAAAFIKKGEPVTHLEAVLNKIRAGLAALEQPFRDGRIGAVEVRDFYISGLDLGRRSTEPVSIEKGKLAKTIGGDLLLEASGLTDRSDFEISALMAFGKGGAGGLELKAGPFSALEWMRSPATGLDVPNGAGSDSKFSVALSMPFSTGEGSAFPTAVLSVGEGDLRIGRLRNTRIDSAEIHLKLFPDRNQIELERSTIAAGDVNVVLLGGVRPVDQVSGYGGNAEIELIANPVTAGALMGGDGFAEATARVHGTWQKAERNIRLDEIALATANGGHLSGDADIVLTGKSPGIRLDAKGEKLSAAETEKLWPFFLGAKAKEWVANNVEAGQIETASFNLDIPPGRLAQYRPGNGPAADEVVITGKLKDFRFRTVGDLPLVASASGEIRLNGTRFKAEIGSSPLAGYGPQSAELNNATLEIDDTSSFDAIGSGEVSLSGSAASLAAIANTQPLQVGKAISLDPASVSGKANAEIAFRFHPRKQAKRKQMLGWNALIDLSKAGSSKPLFGRKISNANLFIKSTPEVVRVKGDATIDGYPVELSMVEPVGSTPASRRERTVTATVDHKVLAKNGISVAPVITGQMEVEIDSKAGSPDHYRIDMRNADISLPWIGWTKGAKIPATAEFNLTNTNGVNRLEGFSLKGDGFSVQGSLEFSKAGLNKAKFSNVTLFGDDSFSASISRSANSYKVDVAGKRYDARSVIKTVLHGDRFASEKSFVDVSLTANFGTLVGFSRQTMSNVVLNYSTSGGLLDRLVMRGATARGGTTAIDAKRAGDTTQFDFTSDDAGSLLALADFYSKMRGGKLQSTLVRKGGGPFAGRVKLDNFSIVGGEKLAKLVAAPASGQNKDLERVSGELRSLNTSEVDFDDARATIVKGPGYFQIDKGRMRNSQIGMTFEGMLYDQNERMNLRGTFMPAFAVSRIVGLIPIVGDILSNGKDSGLIGITYRLKGPFKNPGIAVNPMSVMAPGVFRKAFEFTD